VAKPAWPASPECSFLEAARQSVFASTTEWAHYLAPWPDETLSGWMKEPLPLTVERTQEAEPCWPHGGP
ncbi:MAG TPA: hypothetical protein VIL69_00485, partial [Roseomonas sp.]